MGSAADAGLPERQRPGGRRVVVTAFVISAVVHLVAVLLYPVLVGRQAPGTYPAGESVVDPRPAGTQVVRLREVAEAVEPATAPAPVTAVPPVPAPAPAAPAAEEAPPEAAPDPPAVAPRRSAAERLRPGEVDRRLWALPPEAVELTPEQLARLAVIWTILEMNDSIAVAEATARAFTDWTFTDSSGRRWGIADGMVHLGDLTLPLPSIMGTPTGSDGARRAWQDGEIERGAASAAARANMNERIRAIRERIERERRGQVADTSGVR